MKKAQYYTVEIKERNTQFERTFINSSDGAAEYLRQLYDTDIEIYESFYILLLNQGNIVQGFAQISTGGISMLICDMRMIAKYALETLSSSVILCHNHPSGQKKASDNDIRFTKQAVEGLKLLDIKVMDHIIVTADGFMSFADNGMM